MASFLKRLLKNPRRPRRIVVETTNRCNLNCPFCMVGLDDSKTAAAGNAAHSLMSRPQGMMSESVFSRIVSEAEAFGIRSAYLHFQGEPMLNPRTPAFARELKKRGLEVGVFTNGQAFDDGNIAELAEARVDLIRFSIDGATEESYQANRVGGTLEKAMENMRRVVEAVRSRGNRGTKIEWQFLALRNNEKEIGAAEKMAEEIGVGFFVKRFRETDPELAPANPDLRARKLEKPCRDIYKQICFYWNGDVVPCCYDVDADAVMGNIMDAPLEEIWNSERYRGFRDAIDNAAERPEAEPELCRRCLRWG